MITPVTKEAYLDLVRSNAKQPLQENLIDEVLLCLPTDARTENIRTSMEAFCMDPLLGRAGLLEIYPLNEIREALDRPGFKAENWQYDRTTGMTLVNLAMGVHESLSAALYRVYKGPSTKKSAFVAEQFIDEGLGWFRSASSHGRPLKGKEVKLTFQEKKAFGTLFMLTE